MNMYRTQTWNQSLRLAGLLAGVVPLLAGGCGSDEGTSEFAPVYVALAYGIVSATGEPAAGVIIRAHVYESACLPELRLFTSESSVQTDAVGNYAIVLYSNDQTPGQCVVLQRSDTGDSVAVSLASMPFSSQLNEEPRDSIRIDLASD
jgi:hypothetical protein